MLTSILWRWCYRRIISIIKTCIRILIILLVSAAVMVDHTMASVTERSLWKVTIEPDLRSIIARSIFWCQNVWRIDSAVQAACFEDIVVCIIWIAEASRHDVIVYNFLQSVNRWFERPAKYWKIKIRLIRNEIDGTAGHLLSDSNVFVGD